MANRPAKILPIRPRRNDGEGAVGYLMRVAHAHGIRRLPDMVGEIGVPWYGFLRGMHVDAVARSVRIDETALASDTGTSAGSWVHLRGERLRPRQWSILGSRRACPACLDSDRPLRAGDLLPRAWHRAWWDVRPCTVCPTHRVELIDACPCCGSTLDFVHTPIARCAAGHSLMADRPRVTGGYDGDAYIVGRLGGGPRMENVLLDAGTLGEAIEVLELLGSAAGSLATSRKHHALLHAGFSVAAGWPHAFDRLLDQISAKSPARPGKWGVASSYGSLHARLQEMRDGPLTRILKDRLRAHAVRNGLAISRSIFGVVDEPTKVMALTHAAKRMGVGYDRARRELRRRGLVPARTRRGTPIVVPAEAVEELLGQRSGGKTASEAADMLGIGRPQFRCLVAAGLLARGADGFVLSDLEAFVAGLATGAPASFDRSTALPLPAACKSARCRMESGLEAIRTGRLRVAGFVSGKGLRGVFVDVSALRAVGKASRDALTIEDAAAALGIKWQTMRTLIDLRLVRAGEHGVGASAIAAFRRDFVPGVRMARAAGVAPRSLMTMLKDRGIRPAAAPPGCRQVFYRRADIGRLRGKASLPPVLAAAAEEGMP